MKYVDYEKMTVEEYEAAMQRRVYLCDGEREMGFWRKLMCFLWVLVVALVVLALIGAMPLSANATACGILAIIGIPAIGIYDYYNYKKGW